MPLRKSALTYAGESADPFDLPNTCFMESRVVSGFGSDLHKGPNTYFGQLAKTYSRAARARELRKGRRSLSLCRLGRNIRSPRYDPPHAQLLDQAKPLLMNPFFLDRLLEKAQCQSLTMELIRASNMAPRFKPQLRDGGHCRNPVHILGDFRADPCRRD